MTSSTTPTPASSPPFDLQRYRINVPDHLLPSHPSKPSQPAPAKQNTSQRPPASDETPDPDPTHPAYQDANQDGFYYIPNFISAEEESLLIHKIKTAPQPKWKVLQNRRLQYWGGQVTSKNVLIPQEMPEFLVGYPDLVARLKATGAFGGSRHGEPNHCLVNEYLAGQGIMPHEDGAAYFPAVATISLGSHTLLDIYRYVDEELQSRFDEQMQLLDQQHQEGSATGPAEAGRNRDDNNCKGNGDDPGQAGQCKTIPKERIEGNVKVVRGARAREPDPVFSILQEPRSLLITRGRAYSEFLHGIAERRSDGAEVLCKVINVSSVQDARMREVLSNAQRSLQPPSRLAPMVKREAEGEAEGPTELERETRLSLTFRDVEKVSKGLGGLLGAMTRA